ncbi:MAG: hypothetical protein GX913_02780 [Clostridiales bacterium]|nr:hypothetical protein [Clostridiales bacterium]
MKTALTVILIILAIMAIILVVFYFLGKKAEKKSVEQKSAMDAAAQTMSFFIIDKKRLKIKDANLPKVVGESIPKYMKWAKLPIVKVKVGSRVMSLIADEKVYGQLIPKQEVKAVVSGIYITSAKRIRGPVPEPKVKKGFLAKAKSLIKKDK